jgi:hypothetical protein
MNIFLWTDKMTLDNVTANRKSSFTAALGMMFIHYFIVPENGWEKAERENVENKNIENRNYTNVES